MRERGTVAPYVFMKDKDATAPQRCIVAQSNHASNKDVAPPARREWVFTTAVGMPFERAVHFIAYTNSARKSEPNKSPGESLRHCNQSAVAQTGRRIDGLIRKDLVTPAFSWSFLDGRISFDNAYPAGSWMN